MPSAENDQTTNNAQAAWFLAGQIGSGEITHIALRQQHVLIGRNPDSTLCVPSRAVSSKHARIDIDDDALVLTDLDSTNGTFVNGERVAGEVALRCDDLIQFADVPMRVCRHSSSQTVTKTIPEDVYDEAIALVQFDKLMSERQITPHYQPVIDLNSLETIGYEVLGRSRLFGVSSPVAMFRAAAKLNLAVQLSQMFRWEGIHQSCGFATPPHLFLNTHPAELSESGLIESLQAVRQVAPRQLMTLEIHEAAITDERMMSELRAGLNDLDISLAYDDFGAGQARLVELVKVRPEYLKFDISLIHRIHEAPAQQQQLVASLVKVVRDLSITPLAEGVECEQENVVCQQMGFELAQGFYFGKPAPFPATNRPRP